MTTATSCVPAVECAPQYQEVSCWVSYFSLLWILQLRNCIFTPCFTGIRSLKEAYIIWLSVQGTVNGPRIKNKVRPSDLSLHSATQPFLSCSGIITWMRIYKMKWNFAYYLEFSETRGATSSLNSLVIMDYCGFCLQAPNGEAWPLNSGHLCWNLITASLCWS